MKLSSKIMLLILIIVVAAAIWGYFTASFPPPFPAWHRATTEPASSQPDLTQGLEASMSRPFSYGAILYSITGTDRVNEIKRGTESLTASGNFLLMFLSVKNQGREPLAFESSDFALYDNQGRKFTVHKDATKLAVLAHEKEYLFDIATQPGLERDTVLVFDIPKEATGLSLRLFNGYLDVKLSP